MSRWCLLSPEAVISTCISSAPPPHFPALPPSCCWHGNSTSLPATCFRLCGVALTFPSLPPVSFLNCLLRHRHPLFPRFLFPINGYSIALPPLPLISSQP